MQVEIDGVTLNVPEDFDKRLTIRTTGGMILLNVQLGTWLLNMQVVGYSLPEAVSTALHAWGDKFADSEEI